MGSAGVVAILTQRFDPHADPVIEELTRRGVEVVRFDTGDFPVDMRIQATTARDGWDGLIRLQPEAGGRTLELERVRSIWYRRPSWFRFADTMPTHQRSFARGEALAALGGILRTLDCRWVSHPDALAVAAYKPLQLVRAARLGFPVPETLITNDPAAARAFLDEHGPDVVYKTLGLQQVTGPDGMEQVVFTSAVAPHLGSLDRVTNTPCCFQKVVKKRTELRVTVIGDRVFAVAIDSAGSDPANLPVIDWRADLRGASYSPFTLPPAIEDACRELVAGYGLAFGAIDVIVTPDDDFVFLEINANGQWRWLEEETGLPMTDALIELLTA